MKKLVFWLFFGISKLIAALPFWLLYRISDVVSFFIFRFYLYRRRIVARNIRNSFPEKPTSKHLKIQRKFYRNLIDIFFETLKTYQTDKEKFLKSCKVNNPEVLDRLLLKKKDVFLAIGHNGNWEVISQYISLVLDYKSIALYKKLSNKYVDDFVKRIREQWGKGAVYESQSAYRLLAAEKDAPKAVIIIGDQTPAGLESDYWTSFLYQETPFFIGLEKMARKLNYAVVFVEVYRSKRGKYEINYILICDEGQKTKEFEISSHYVRLLESSIRNQPDNWLWSHRRWKHKRMKSTNEA